jgi:hypothetical protein
LVSEVLGDIEREPRMESREDQENANSKAAAYNHRGMKSAGGEAQPQNHRTTMRARSWQGQAARRLVGPTAPLDTPGQQEAQRVVSAMRVQEGAKIAQAKRTFRIFASSTFHDLKEERNALQQKVFPRLRQLCLQRGVRFQAVDLRWGVSQQASPDQQAMNICLGEIARCQKATPRPDLVVLLGNRYGWQILPSEIPAEEFEEIEGRISGDADRTLLTTWYRRDDNAVPAEYCLYPRTGEFEEYVVWEEQAQRTTLSKRTTPKRRPSHGGWSP